MTHRRALPAMSLAHLGATLLLCAALVPAAFAVPADPTPIILEQPDGTPFWARVFGDEWANGHEALDGYAIVRDPASGYWKYADKGPSGVLVPSPYIVTRDLPGALPPGLRPDPAPGAPVPGVAPPQSGTAALGSRPTLVILVQFTDVSGRTTAADWQARFFGATNSVKNHYAVSSYGQMTLTPATESEGTANDGVVGWLTLNSAHPNTAGNIGSANQQLAKDAILAADPYVNFAAFDTNGDGRITPDELMIVVIVAGNERSFGGASACSPSVWGHKWQIYLVTPPVVDGVTVGADGYAQFGEMHCQTSSPPGQQATIGIMAHEMGHLFGLPDLYDIDNSSEGIGNWSLMAGGSWNRQTRAGDSPSLLDPWSKAFLGWITPTQVTGTLTNQSIPASATNASAVYQLLSGSAIAGTGEYFLVENRQQTSYDVGLPGAGLLIWHIDESQTSNRNECVPGGTPACSSSIHYRVALVQADNLFNLEHASNRGDGGDPFPGTSGNRSFTDSTSPNSRLWNGAASGASVINISDAASVMTATLSVGAGATPAISVTPSSQDFGAVAIGQTADRTFTVSNSGGGTLTGSASTSAPFSIVSGGSYSLAAGASQTVTARFSPTAAGTFASSVSFSVTNGTGLTRAVTGVGGTQVCTAAITPGTVSGSLTDSDCNSLNRPPAKADRYTFSGSAGQVVTITMRAPLPSFEDTYLYLIGPSGTVVASNDDCRHPTDLSSCINNFALPAAGTYTIEATSYSTTARGPYTLTLSVPTGAILSVTPASLNFGTVAVGSSTTQNFTVQNAGFGTLTGSASTAAPFSIVSGGSYSLGAGASQTVTVRFAPTSSGSFSGTATFSSSAGASVSRAVTGQTATIPCVNVSITPGTRSGNLDDADCDAPNRAGARADRYIFSAVAGQRATINMNSTAFDTYLFLVGPSGAVAASNDDCPGLNTPDSCITSVTLTSTGTYAIEATSFSIAARGAYTLTLSVVQPTSLLSVTIRGSAAGTVTSSPGGINCGNGTCSASFNSGTTVTLTAAPASGATFRGWSGACTGTALTCAVTVNANVSVSASFAATFTDPTVGGGSTIRGAHVADLRAAINMLRSRYNLTAVAWTDPTLVAGMTIRSVHFSELRTALLAVYVAAGIASPSFTDPVLTVGVTPVRSAHLNELRNAVRALE